MPPGGKAKGPKVSGMERMISAVVQVAALLMLAMALLAKGIKNVILTSCRIHGDQHQPEA